MSELVDRLPGDPIESAYANVIRDRTAQRYVDATARDNSVQFPTAGDLAYLTSLGVLTHYDGTRWVDLLDDTGGEMSGKLDGQGTGALDDWGSITINELDPINFRTVAWREAGRGTVELQGYESVNGKLLAITARDGADAPEAGLAQFVVGAGGGGPGGYRGGVVFPNESADMWWQFSKSGQSAEKSVGFVWDESLSQMTLAWGGQGAQYSAGRLQYDTLLTLQNLGSATNRVQMSGPVSTTTGIGTVRNVYIGTAAPDDGDGNNGDLYIRYVP